MDVIRIEPPSETISITDYTSGAIALAAQAGAEQIEILASDGPTGPRGEKGDQGPNGAVWSATDW